MIEKEVPCVFYYYIHDRMYNKFGESEITIKNAKSFLFEWRLLKQIRPIIIKELELLGLIERVNKRMIKINKSKFDIENLSEVYRSLGLY